MYEDYLDFFSTRLTKLRMEKGVSAREMSLEIGQSEGYIAQIERKHNFPSMTVFLYICEYLNIKPQDFLNDGIVFPMIFYELLANIKELDEEQLTNVNNIVRGLLKNQVK